ncbi:MAG: PP2C family protein-serine/threonine phosphatase [Pseudomonadales bacterium]
MRLVLAGADDTHAASLCAQLSRLGFDVLPASDVDLVIELCGRAMSDLAIVSDVAQAAALAAEQPWVPLVLATDQPVGSDGLLSAIRIGVCDVWPLPMGDDDLVERITQINERRLAVASDTERKLSGFLADLERDQRAGRYIQMGMLPPSPMAIDGFRFQHRILPSLILSGDFVDYFRITDRHFAFYVADVSGHGASSAFVTVLLKNFSRRLRREHRPSMLSEPGEILQWVNRELLEQNIDKHVALMLGVGDLQTEEIRLVNGGHYPPAILVKKDGDSAFLEQRGKPVGLFDEVQYLAHGVSLDAGDRLVMFSDGVMDAMGSGDLSSKEQRLLEAARVGSDVDEMWELLEMSFGPEVKPDDMTCLVVQRES